MNRDQLTNVLPRNITKDAYAVVSRLQMMKNPAHQILALAVVTRIVADVHEVDIREELERVGRIIRDADGIYLPEVRALRAYVENELT